MKSKVFLLTFLIVLAGNLFPGATSGFPRVFDDDDFEVALSANKSVISFGENASEFYVSLKNKTGKPQRLFENWNSWGYQNISFYFYTEDTVYVTTKKSQDFTRNFPSIYEIPPGEMMVFPIKLNDQWEGLPSLPAGKESNVRIQVVYTGNPTFEAKEEKAWIGIVASKIYQQKMWYITPEKTPEAQAK